MAIFRTLYYGDVTIGVGGRITITWYDDDDLGRLVDRLSMVDR